MEQPDIREMTFRFIGWVEGRFHPNCPLTVYDLIAETKPKCLKIFFYSTLILSVESSSKKLEPCIRTVSVPVRHLGIQVQKTQLQVTSTMKGSYWFQLLKTIPGFPSTSYLPLQTLAGYFPTLSLLSGPLGFLSIRLEFSRFLSALGNSCLEFYLAF